MFYYGVGLIGLFIIAGTVFYIVMNFFAYTLVISFYILRGIVRLIYRTCLWVWIKTVDRRTSGVVKLMTTEEKDIGQ